MIEIDYEDEPFELHTEILPRLWQGGTAERDQLHNSKHFSTATKDQPFTSVVTLDAQSQPVKWGVKEYRFGIEDGPIEREQIKDILKAADWAYEQWKTKETVLIRCQAGANRSGLIMALVLMKDGWSAQKAIDHIRLRRSFALSNSAFVAWLKEI